MEIVAALKGQGKSVRWIITGAPDPHNPDSMKYYRMLRSLRSQLKVTKEVVFLFDKFDKPVSGIDLRCLYRVCDMLLFPSEREGFGLPVLEAGLAALLTVISDIPVLRELAGQDAVFIRLGDSADMIAENIITAIDKRPELRNRKDVISNFAWSVVFNEKILPAIMKPNTIWQ
jgi:glycosyltransferase involved in cell wall biosynthesis